MISVGTAPGNDLVLSDETVSRYHLEIRRDEDRILIKDLGTTNGTALREALVDQARVLPGTVLSLGNTKLEIRDGEPLTFELHPEERLGRLRGRSQAMLRLMARIKRAASSDASVLLVGETGTGKELTAQAIHEASRRGSRPFETVDCGALLPTLVASELFGHEKGAFTGADRRHIGAFERADGGTLFLDEIGELPSSLQPALLGALERRSFRRVGGNTSIKVDVRVVCATHRDLRAEVNQGRFRQDLYYRLAVVPLLLPPLRERTDDILLLVEHFLEEARFDGELRDIFSPKAIENLKNHRWPGNIRELRNFVEAAVVMGETPHFGAERSARRASTMSRTLEADEALELPYGEARAAVLEGFEAKYLSALLKRAKGNVSAAAREAKMNRSYLIKMLKRHGLKR